MLQVSAANFRSSIRFRYKKGERKREVHFVAIGIANTIHTILSLLSLSNPSPSVWLFSGIDHPVHFVAISAREGEYHIRSDLLSGDCESKMEQIDKVLEIDILGGIKMMQSISAYCNYTIGHGNGNFGLTL